MEASDKKSILQSYRKKSKIGDRSPELMMAQHDDPNGFRSPELQWFLAFVG
jgi:hypothetical protein